MAEQATISWNVTLIDKEDDLYEVHQGHYSQSHDSVTSDYRYICNVHGETNARLIAAAPDLLAKLQWVVDACENRDEPVDVVLNNMESFCRAAIAKVQGGAK